MKLKILHIFLSKSYETGYLFKTNKFVTKQEEEMEIR